MIQYECLMWKLAIGILVLIMVAGAGGWWYLNNKAASSAIPAASAPAPLVATQDVAPATPPTAGTPNSVVIPATGSSDDALAQESAEVDTQISGLTTDSAKADTSLSSQ